MLKSLSFRGAGGQQEAQNDGRAAARSFAVPRWGMLGAAAEWGHEMSNEAQPLSAPLTARPAPRCNKVIYVEAAKQGVPVALWVDGRRGVEADPLTQHRLKQANEMCAQHRFSALKPRGPTKPDFSRVSFLLPHVFAGQLWKYSSWAWTPALDLFKRKKKTNKNQTTPFWLTSYFCLLHHHCLIIANDYQGS